MLNNGVLCFHAPLVSCLAVAKSEAGLLKAAGVISGGALWEAVGAVCGDP